LEAARVADLGEQVAGEDRADAEDRLQRLAATVGASEGACAFFCVSVGG